MPRHIASLSPIHSIFLTIVEPICALGGSFLCLTDPLRYITTFTAAASPATPLTAPTTQILFDQVAACYLFFGLVEALVLRSTKDVQVWRAVVLSILVCDAVHLWGSWRALGDDAFWNPVAWRPEDMVNLGLLWGPMGLRLSFLLGVGVQTERVEVTRSKTL